MAERRDCCGEDNQAACYMPGGCMYDRESDTEEDSPLTEEVLRLRLGSIEHELSQIEADIAHLRERANFLKRERTELTAKLPAAAAAAVRLGGMERAFEINAAGVLVPVARLPPPSPPAFQNLPVAREAGNRPSIHERARARRDRERNASHGRAGSATQLGGMERAFEINAAGELVPVARLPSRVEQNVFSPQDIPGARENRPSIHERVRLRRDRERNASHGHDVSAAVAQMGGLSWNSFVKKIQKREKCNFHDALVLASPEWALLRKKSK